MRDDELLLNWFRTATLSQYLALGEEIVNTGVADSSAKFCSTPWENPMGIAGLEFVEFAAPDPAALGQTFERLGFIPIARHISKNVMLYRQGEINFLINAEPDSFAARYASGHGQSICAIGVRVLNAQRAFERAIELGAWQFETAPTGPNELKIPGIQGIGDSRLYFVDQWRGKSDQNDKAGNVSIYDIDFRPIDPEMAAEDWQHRGAGLLRVDHLTQTVGAGLMQDWLDFYRDLFGFREIHEVNADWRIASESRVMLSPCELIRIPLYEEGTKRTRLMHQYLQDSPSEGVQHIALETDDIFATVESLSAHGIEFVTPPARYYEQIDERIPGHGLSVDALREHKVLVDGSVTLGRAPQLFLQAFIKHYSDEISFEIVQRRGHHGFGEGNLQALEDAR
jgi:4-hydroxyphenylpyruvate dioxygenase